MTNKSSSSVRRFPQTALSSIVAESNCLQGYTIRGVRPSKSSPRQAQRVQKTAFRALAKLTQAAINLKFRLPDISPPDIDEAGFTICKESASQNESTLEDLYVNT
ncbi:uncharacterized protein LOC110066194 [Orbicella faveolata]|uniref:uncharacterized protein LOC110066194 n=1 Tax=Orbicella faveolata TaxID=48498 RepID=UPI0009E4767F|nr:uncharacterized protein LOC110066194 [Orbicella faveolata]